jgi:triosephosphate isomerase
MKYVIANFKSHKTASEVKSWLSAFQTTSPDAKIIVALPFPYLSLATSSQLDCGAQDVSPFPAGSYTGAVNATQLKDLGIKYCLVGHSERRRYFHETSVEVADKVEELLAEGITPVICVSEADLAPQFAALKDEATPKCLFAYEVLSDIGGTETTPISHIIEMIGLLKKYTNNSSLGLLYGGSVNPNNVSSLVGIADGLLVATASLDPISFTQVVTGFTTNV